ncbi:MAG: aldolase [Candidatus Pacebacteria bacterium]|nr:aldolase [Candidatus Paceibacterota bacterium]
MTQSSTIQILPEQLDQLVYQAVFAESDQQKAAARYQIWQAADQAGIILSSIHDFYMARGREELPLNLTVPAINVRGMAYNTARAAFQAAVEQKVGAVIFEIARSEIGYTDQTPLEYVTVISAAALRQGWSGPLFIQGDHFQAKSDKPGQPKTGEINKIKDLIKEAIEAGFYNIDIDMSTLVSLDKPREQEQQLPNAQYSAELTDWIRSLEPAGVTVSVGGEIGHIGGKNSTAEDFIAFIDQYRQFLPDQNKGMSKVSVQTGTHHGGVVLPNGELADVDVDFSILSKISKLARDKYQIAGTVQHGASTLPDEFFAQFADSQAIEVHLATGFQNIIMDHPAFPQDLLREMYQWLEKNKLDEKKESQTMDQFYYKLRKKAWGQFKKQVWDIPEEVQAKLRQALTNRFKFMFDQLNVKDTQQLVAQFVKPVRVEKGESDFLPRENKQINTQGLAD